MTKQQGRGVQVLSQLVKDLSRTNPTEARAIIDGLTDEEVGDTLAAHAAACVATDGDEGRDVFVESIAARMSAGAADEARQ